MFSCGSTSLLNSSSSSPTSTQPHSTIISTGTDAANLLISSSLSPRSTSQFKQSSAVKSSSKWKAVLAHLAPPRLLSSRPVRSTHKLSATASLKSPSRRGIPSAAISSLPASSSEFPNGFDLPSDTSISAEPVSADSHIPLSAAVAVASTETFVAVADDLLTLPDSFPFSFDVASDVEKLLHILLETPLQEDANKRTHALAALCALCVSSSNNTKRCVAAGGVEMLIDILNITAPPSVPAAAILEESEKALLLLQLLTSSTSDDGCNVALRHSSLIIAALGKKLLRGSESCTSSTIAILNALCRHSDAALFRKAVSETGIPSKLVVVLQVAPKDSTKRRAGRLLRLLAEQSQEHDTI